MSAQQHTPLRAPVYQHLQQSSALHGLRDSSKHTSQRPQGWQSNKRATRTHPPSTRQHRRHVRTHARNARMCSVWCMMHMQERVRAPVPDDMNAGVVSASPVPNTGPAPTGVCMACVCLWRTWAVLRHGHPGRRKLRPQQRSTLPHSTFDA
jgi:hypothetical protein